MKIPIGNLYFLLCYAWDVIEAGDVVSVGAHPAVTIQDLLAQVLAARAVRVMRRGPDREYMVVEEEVVSPRGRLDLGTTIKRALRRRGLLAVAVDDLSVDCPVNQTVKATARALVSCPGLSRSTTEQLYGLLRLMSDVTEVPLTRELLRRVRLHRNNRAYELLFRLCLMIFENLQPVEGGTGWRFPAYERDERALRRLFERFVATFYRREQHRYSVHSPKIKWFGASALGEYEVALPQMRTDMVLESTDHSVIVDTKFTGNAFQDYMGAKTLRSPHLYQVFAYLQNMRKGSAAGRTIDALLLYPAVGREFSYGWQVDGATVRVASVDLASDWSAIRGALLSAIGCSDVDSQLSAG